MSIIGHTVGGSIAALACALYFVGALIFVMAFTLAFVVGLMLLEWLR
jgi:hypothetical protein